jgi:hypothetical protein
MSTVTITGNVAGAGLPDYYVNFGKPYTHNPYLIVENSPYNPGDFPIAALEYTGFSPNKIISFIKRDEEEKKDNDYNVANIFKIEPKSISQLRKLRKDQYNIINMFRLHQVGIYRDNIKDEQNCAVVCRHLAFEQFDPEKVLMNIEMNFQGKNFVTHFSNNDEYFAGMIIHTYHTKPIPGEEPPRKKLGFKVSSDKEHFCKQGMKAISERTIVVTNRETYKEFCTFGKDKKGRYKGIGNHDDSVMTVLNTTRAFEEDQYKAFLYDLLENMSDTPQKRLISNMLEFEYDNSDISDDTFNALYSLNQPTDEMTTINNIFNKPKAGYTPGLTFNRR